MLSRIFKNSTKSLFAFWIVLLSASVSLSSEQIRGCPRVDWCKWIAEGDFVVDEDNSHEFLLTNSEARFRNTYEKSQEGVGSHPTLEQVTLPKFKDPDTGQNEFATINDFLSRWTVLAVVMRSRKYPYYFILQADKQSVAYYDATRCSGNKCLRIDPEDDPHYTRQARGHFSRPVTFLAIRLSGEEINEFIEMDLLRDEKGKDPIEVNVKRFLQP